jgi:hypothetical protein
MARPALRIEISMKDQKELRGLLSGGVQQARVVLRALALLQLAKGVSAPRISTTILLTPHATRKVGHRYQEGGLERALYERPRPGAAEVLDDSQKTAADCHGLQQPAGGAAIPLAAQCRAFEGRPGVCCRPGQRPHSGFQEGRNVCAGRVRGAENAARRVGLQARVLAGSALPVCDRRGEPARLDSSAGDAGRWSTTSDSRESSADR